MAAVTAHLTATAPGHLTAQVRAIQALPAQETRPHSDTRIRIHKALLTANPPPHPLPEAVPSHTAKEAATVGAAVHLSAPPAQHQAAILPAPVLRTGTAAEHLPDAVLRIPPAQVTATAIPTAEQTEHQAVSRKVRATALLTVVLYPIREVRRQATEKQHQTPLPCRKEHLTAPPKAVPHPQPKVHLTAHLILLDMVLITVLRKVFPRAYRTVRAAEHPFQTAMELPAPAAILTVLHIPTA